MKFTALCLAAACLLSTTANAALLLSDGGQTVYDTDLNITWMANANLAATNTFGLATNVDLGAMPGVNTYGGSVIYNDGTMTWGGAQRWIGAMNSTNYLGYNNWRLPNYEVFHLYLNELGGVDGQPLTYQHNVNYYLFQNIYQIPRYNYAYWLGLDHGGMGPEYFLFQSNFSDFSSSGAISMSVLAVRDGQGAPVPVPAAAWLLGSGLLGLIGVARRKAA